MYTSHVVKVVSRFYFPFQLIMDIWNRIRDFSEDDFLFYIFA